MQIAFIVLLCLHVTFGSLLGQQEDAQEESSQLIEEPRSYFNKADNDHLLEHSLWSNKDFVLKKRNEIPILSIHLQNDKHINDIIENINQNVIANKNIDEVTKKRSLSGDRELNSFDTDFDESDGSEYKSHQAYDLDEEDDGDSDEDEVSGSGESEGSGKKREIININEDDIGFVTESGSGADDTDSSELLDDSPPDQIDSGSNDPEDDSGSSENVPEKTRLHEAKVNIPNTHYDSSRTKKNIIPKPFKKNSILKPHKTQKRQFIARPRFIVRNGYVYMKAPPMTQKTIVTTHIPRPPMMLPYNTFMHRYRTGLLNGVGMGRRNHYMLPQQQMYDSSDEGGDVDDARFEESKWKK